MHGPSPSVSRRLTRWTSIKDRLLWMLRCWQLGERTGAATRFGSAFLLAAAVVPFARELSHGCALQGSDQLAPSLCAYVARYVLDQLRVHTNEPTMATNRPRNTARVSPAGSSLRERPRPSHGRIAGNSLWEKFEIKRTEVQSQTAFAGR